MNTPQRPRHYLIVSGDSRTGDLIRRRLLKEGAVVDVEWTLDLAHRRFAWGDYDAVLVDLSPELIGGRELLAAARLNPSPVVVLAGSDEADRESAERSGATRILEKPYTSLEEIVQTLRRLAHAEPSDL